MVTNDDLLRHSSIAKKISSRVARGVLLAIGERRLVHPKSFEGPAYGFNKSKSYPRVLIDNKKWSIELYKSDTAQVHTYTHKHTHTHTHTNTNTNTQITQISDNMR